MVKEVRVVEQICGRPRKCSETLDLWELSGKSYVAEVAAGEQAPSVEGALMVNWVLYLGSGLAGGKKAHEGTMRLQGGTCALHVRFGDFGYDARAILNLFRKDPGQGAEKLKGIVARLVVENGGVL